MVSRDFHNLVADWAKKLCKPSKIVESVLVLFLKNLEVLYLNFFVVMSQ